MNKGHQGPDARRCIINTFEYFDFIERLNHNKLINNHENIFVYQNQITMERQFVPAGKLKAINPKWTGTVR